MSYSGDAAEQVVRMTLEGTEVAVKIAGKGAERLAAMIYAVLKDQKRTRGKIRLTNLLRSGKELKVFGVRDDELKMFCAAAKKYGVLYTVLKDMDANDGRTDIMVRAEDIGKINRIFERFGIATVEIADVKDEIENAREKREAEKADAEAQPKEKAKPDNTKNAEAIDSLFKPDKEERAANPMEGRTPESRQSGSSSGTKPNGETKEAIKPTADERRAHGERPSVKEELKEIKDDLDKKEKLPEKKPKVVEHQAPRKKNRKRGVRA